MKEYYKADNELVKQVIDDFRELEIGGKTWVCTGSGWMPNDDGSLPTDRRMEGEVELQQKDGTTHPKITLTISIGPGG
jgi:hypothetical protein